MVITASYGGGGAPDHWPVSERGTLWKRFANASMTAFWCVANPIYGEHSRIAFCECGAQLAGDSRGQLFDAAQAHLAHHHPELLGALGLEVVQQMVEERPGAVNA
jgi:hypothetical protein